MMRKIIAALSMTLAISSWADEQMLLNVDLNNGTNRVYNANEAGLIKGVFTNNGEGLNIAQGEKNLGSFDVADIKQLNVTKGTVNVSITRPDGTQYNYQGIPQLLRQTSESVGDPVLFGLGTIASSTAAGLCSGEYGVYLSVSPSLINTGELDVESVGSSVKVQLVKYEDGGRKWLLESPVSGTVNTSLNNKTKDQTVVADVVYEDGTELAINYTGAATDITEGAMSDMIPDQVYGNVLLYYNADSVLTTSATITGYSTATKKNNGEQQIRFTFKTDPESNYSASQFYVQFSPTLINQGKYNAPDAPDKSWIFKYGEIELYANEPHASSMDSGYYKNLADNGTFRIDQNEDGTYNIFFDIQFFYNNAANNLTHSGNPSRVVINYKSGN